MQPKGQSPSQHNYFKDHLLKFQAAAEKNSRSQMNVTFVTGDPERDAAFITQAAQQGFNALKGHRSVGGMRASIYNAFPEEGVRALAEFMKDFEAAG